MDRRLRDPRRAYESPLLPTIPEFGDKSKLDPVNLALEVRRHLGFLEDADLIPSVVDVLEKFGIRVIENPTDLSIDGLAARYGQSYVVVLNSTVPSDRSRLNAGHELGHVLYGDCDNDDPTTKGLETRAFLFASHFLISSSQLKEAFKGKSMVRLIRSRSDSGYRWQRWSTGPRSTASSRSKRPGLSGLLSPNATGGHANPDTSVPTGRPDSSSSIEDAINNKRLSLREIADLCGVRPEAIRKRLDFAIGVGNAPEDEGADTLLFPG